MADIKMELGEKIMAADYIEARRLVLEEFQRRYLRYHIRAAGGNVAKAARNCGMNAATIHELRRRVQI